MILDWRAIQKANTYVGIKLNLLIEYYYKYDIWASLTIMILYFVTNYLVCYLYWNVGLFQI